MFSLAALALVVPQAFAAGFDKAAFDALSPRDKMKVVSGALNWRDQQLSNISYSLVETILYDGALVRQSRFDFKRSGNQYQLHCKHLKTTGGLALSEYWSQWDGQQCRALTNKNGDLSGIISAEDSPFLHEVLYNNLLGVRTERDNMTVPEWIEAATAEWKPPAPYEIKTSGAERSPLIEVSITAGPDHIDTYVVDPTRDYMLVQYRIDHVRQPSRKPSIRVEVTNASKDSGLWVPMEANHVATLPSKGARTYRVDRFSRGSVQPSELQVEFLVGTRVLDTIAKSTYVVQHGGNLRRSDYYDPGTGQVFGPDGRIVAGPTTNPTSGPAPAR
jgi:hypothetical protein